MSGYDTGQRAYTGCLKANKYLKPHTAAAEALFMSQTELA